MRRLVSTRCMLAAALCCAPIAAHATDLPTRKAGLWELKMVMAGGQLPQMTMQQCTDETTDKQMISSFGATQNDVCAKRDIVQTASGFTMDTECTAAGMSMTSHAEITGDFNSAYSVKVTSKRAGGPAGMPRDTNMTMEAKWLGACAAGQKAGDIIMPGGMKMNIKDMEAMRDNMRNMMKKQ